MLNNSDLCRKIDYSTDKIIVKGVSSVARKKLMSKVDEKDCNKSREKDSRRKIKKNSHHQEGRSRSETKKCSNQFKVPRIPAKLQGVNNQTC